MAKLATVAVLSVLVLLATTMVLEVSAAAGTFPVPSNHKLIKTVTGATFREYVVDPTLPVVLQFYSKNKASKAFAPIYEELAEKLDGYAKFTVMDSSTEEGKGLGEMFGATSGGPTLMLFNPELFPVAGPDGKAQEGQYMKQPLTFQGAASFERVAKFVLMATASHHIERIEDWQDMDDFLAKYKMQDLPKAVLFYNDDVVPPMYKAVSHDNRYGMLFGVVNASAAEVKELVKKYDIKTVPSVITFGSGDEGTDILADDPAGSITLEKLSQFVSRVAFDKEKKMQLQGYFIEMDIAAKKKAAEEAKMNKALPPLTITSEKDWSKHCLNRKKGYCVAVFVEDINTVDMEMLTETGRKMAQRTNSPSQIAVIDGQANYDIAEHFNAVNGYPEVVFINPAKKGFHNLIGSFSVRSMVNFFADKATSSRGKRYETKQVPAFKEPEAPAPEDDGSISDEL